MRWTWILPWALGRKLVRQVARKGDENPQGLVILVQEAVVCCGLLVARVVLGLESSRHTREGSL